MSIIQELVDLHDRLVKDQSPHAILLSRVLNKLSTLDIIDDHFFKYRDECMDENDDLDESDFDAGDFWAGWTAAEIYNGTD